MVRAAASPEHHHRDLRVRQYLVRHAPEEERGNVAPAMGGHEDRVAARVARRSDDAFGRCPRVGHQGLAGYPCGLRGRLHWREIAFAPLAEAALEFLDRPGGNER